MTHGNIKLNDNSPRLSTVFARKDRHRIAVENDGGYKRTLRLAAMSQQFATARIRKEPLFRIPAAP